MIHNAFTLQISNCLHGLAIRGACYSSDLKMILVLPRVLWTCWLLCRLPGTVAPVNKDLLIETSRSTNASTVDIVDHSVRLEVPLPSHCLVHFMTGTTSNSNFNKQANLSVCNLNYFIE